MVLSLLELQKGGENVLNFLKEKMEELLCYFGLHDRYYDDPSRGMCGGTSCRRSGCTWHIPAIIWPEPTPMPHCEPALNPDALKMYILIREDTPVSIVPLIAVHTAMGTYKKFENWRLTKKWFETELQKTVICKVTAEQFEKAKEYGDHFTLTEVHHKELGELGLGFAVQSEYHKFFKYLPLYRTE